MLKRLQTLSSDEIPIIVEGKRDVNALKKLGIRGKFITIAQGKSLLSLAEKISEKASKAVILTDFDKRGEKTAKKLAACLQGEGVAPNLELRKNFKKLVKKGLKDVESLAVHFENVLKQAKTKKLSLSFYDNLL